MSKKILILGVNGFIGHRLTERLLAETDHEIIGIDLSANRLDNCLNNPRFRFTEGDMLVKKDWVESQIAECDIILPLVAIATPATYVTDPLKIFELDFEANLEIVRHCVKHKKRLIFPSTSEVYGMCTDDGFDEMTSQLITGPISKQRWIYSCSKQMLDRVIYAYGTKENLEYTLFRPFNWIGPQQDDVFNPKAGSSRVVSQFIGHIIRGEAIQLVNGGEQRRCFTYIDDGIDALITIIQHPEKSNQQIFNIGNPSNNYSIKELAEKLLSLIKTYPAYQENADRCQLEISHPDNYYGKGYQDVQMRKPSIKRANEILDWHPRYDMDEALSKTVDFYLSA